MYATVEDFKQRLGSIFEAIYAEGDAAALDDLADAQAEVDGCISKRYRIPVTATASLPLLKGFVLTLAEERTYARAAGASYADKVTARCAQVRKYLEEIRSGIFVLPDASERGEDTASAAGGISVIAGEPPLYTRSSLQGY